MPIKAVGKLNRIDSLSFQYQDKKFHILIPLNLQKSTNLFRIVCNNKSRRNLQSKETGIPFSNFQLSGLLKITQNKLVLVMGIGTYGFE